MVLESRPELFGNRAARLTVNQIDYVLREGGNQVRVILGTSATGIADVARTLRDATGRGASWTGPAIGSANVLRRALTDGRAGERRLLVSDLSDGSDGSAKACPGRWPAACSKPINGCTASPRCPAAGRCCSKRSWICTPAITTRTAPCGNWTPGSQRRMAPRNSSRRSASARTPIGGPPAWRSPTSGTTPGRATPMCGRRPRPPVSHRPGHAPSSTVWRSSRCGNATSTGCGSSPSSWRP